MKYNNLVSIVESILFVASEKLSLREIVYILNENGEKVTNRIIIDVLELLEQKYSKIDSGLSLLRIEDSYQIISNIKNNKFVEYISVKKKKKTLSQASMEVLSIIAYRQPVTRLEIDEIRGINSESIVKNLLDMKIIEEKGRLDRIGRPLIYGTTDLFLREFGLSSIKDLPSIDKLESELYE